MKRVQFHFCHGKEAAHLRANSWDLQSVAKVFNKLLPQNTIALLYVQFWQNIRLYRNRSKLTVYPHKFGRLKQNYDIRAPALKYYMLTERLYKKCLSQMSNNVEIAQLRTL